jgi:hypothetical protein
VAESLAGDNLVLHYAEPGLLYELPRGGVMNCIAAINMSMKCIIMKVKDEKICSEGRLG